LTGYADAGLLRHGGNATAWRCSRFERALAPAATIGFPDRVAIAAAARTGYRKVPMIPNATSPGDPGLVRVRPATSITMVVKVLPVRAGGSSAADCHAYRNFTASRSA
jgi:hypothetical protein